MKSRDDSAVFNAALIIIAGGIGFGLAMQLQAQLAGVFRVLVAGIRFAFPAFCGVQARRVFKERSREE